MISNFFISNVRNSTFLKRRFYTWAPVVQLRNKFIICFFYIVVKVLSFGKAGSFQLIDRGILELIGPTGLVRLFSLFSKNISKTNDTKIWMSGPIYFELVGQIWHFQKSMDKCPTKTPYFPPWIWHYYFTIPTVTYPSISTCDSK